jgi:Major Facilitator Superfamily
VVNVAILTIQRSLHLSVADLEWVVSSYLLTLAGLLLVGGRLADVYGRHRLFLAAAAFLAVEARAAHPMVDLAMFRRREFSGSAGTMMIWAFGTFGIYFFTSLYLQGTLGFSPVKAGPAFVPMALCLAVFAGIAPRVAARAGAHRTAALGMLLMVAGLILFARLGLHAGYAGLLPGFMLFGAGAGLMNVPVTNAVMQATPPEQVIVVVLVDACGQPVEVVVVRAGAAEILRHRAPPLPGT